jgi:hypothetical protein
MTASFKMMTSGDPWINLDGRLNAPSGSAQYPNLFSGPFSPNGGPQTSVGPFSVIQSTNSPYAYRPPWHAAGVDYAVGIPQGQTLILPTQILGSSSPAGNTLTTNSSTTSGNVLHFASTTGVMVGTVVSGTNIPGSTTVVSKTSISVTISNNVSGTVSNGATITFTGINIDTGNLWISLSISNVVIDSIDCSATSSGGNVWQINNKFNNNVFNTTIQNCKWEWNNPNTGTTGQTPVQFLGLANGVTGAGFSLLYCEIDGSGGNECFSFSSNVGINGPLAGTNGCVVKYCWIKNGQANNMSGMPDVLQYCIIENAGVSTNAATHCEYMQTYPTATGNCTFNGTADIAWSSPGGDLVQNVFTAGGSSLGAQTMFHDGVPPQLTDRFFPYYVVSVNSGAQTFQVSATPNGTPIVFSNGFTCKGSYPQYTYHCQFQFNTIIMNNDFDNVAWGTEGFTLNGNGHYGDPGSSFGLWAIYQNVDIGWNTCICVCKPDGTGGGGVTYFFGVDPGLIQGTMSVHDNYCDLSKVKNHILVLQSSGSPQGAGTNANYGGTFSETNNISLITGGVVT